MTDRVLCELFGEIVSCDPCLRQPRIVRPGVAAGLELLDLILNPDHIVRTTEDLSFAGAQTVHRQLRVDVMLDRVSSHREAAASQLGGLLSERPFSPTAGDHARTARLWTPLMHVPRPIVVPIDVYDSDGQLLPRPPQQEIRTLLVAALYHLLRESLYADPDAEQRDTDLGRLLHHDDVARWTLQAAVLAVCESGIARPRSRRRIEQLLERAGCERLDQLDTARLAAVVDGEPDPDKRLALSVLHHKVSGLPALLELIELVYGNYFIIAGLDPVQRDHSVRFSLPDVEASPASPDRQLLHRLRQTVDPRDHNFTARIRLAVPTGISQYRIQLTGSTDAEGESEAAMAVAARVALEPRPGTPELAAVRSCLGRLAADIDRLGADAAAEPDGDGAAGDRRHTTINYEATEARAALESLRAIAAERRVRAGDVAMRWSRSGARLFLWQVRDLEAGAAALEGAVDAAIDRADELARLTAPRPEPAGQAARREPAPQRELARQGPALPGPARPEPVPHDGPVLPDGSNGSNVPGAPATGNEVPDADVSDADVSDADVAERARSLVEALEGVAAAAADPRLDLHLAGDDAPGHETGRVRVNRPFLAAAPRSEAKAVDVWVTMSDEALPYATGMLAPPVGLFAFLWLFGALLFESATWMTSYSLTAGTAGDVLARPADALAAILLLVPGIAMTLTRMPKSTSVRARLRRAARAQVYTAVAVLSVCAVVVTTRAGSDHTDRLDLLFVLRVLRGAAWVIAAWIVWSVCAWALRGTFVWIPKGLSREVAARRRGPPAGGAVRRIGDRVVRRFLGERKRADVELDVAGSRDGRAGGAVPP